MHGTVEANNAMQNCDVLLAVGARFDDRVTGKLSTFAQNAKVIHADIDPAEIGKNRYADVAVIGDVRETIKALIPALATALAKGRADLSPWMASVNKLKSTVSGEFELDPVSFYAAQYYIIR